MECLVSMFGDFNEFHAFDVLNLQYGWPNSLWARQYRHHFINNALIPLLEDIQEDYLAVSSNIDGVGILPTYSGSIASGSTIVAIDVPTFFTSNGSIVSSFTDAVGNVFIWSGSAPPCFSSIPQRGTPNAKGISFASAVGFFSANILSNSGLVSANVASPRKAYCFMCISSIPVKIPYNQTGSSAISILFEVNSVNGLGFAPQAQIMEHNTTYNNFGDVIYAITNTYKDPAFGFIYKNDANPLWGTYWQGSLGNGYIGSYNSKRMAPFLENANPFIGNKCYSPASAIESSSLLYIGLIQKSNELVATQATTYIQIQPLNSCITGGFPQTQGALADIENFNFSGIFFLGNGSLQASSTAFKGILYNLTINTSTTNIQPLNTLQYRNLLKYLASYFRTTTLPKWDSTLCPNPCNTFLP